MFGEAGCGVVESDSTVLASCLLFLCNSLKGEMNFPPCDHIKTQSKKQLGVCCLVVRVCECGSIGAALRVISSDN